LTLKKERPGLHGLTVKFYQAFKEELTAIFLKVFIKSKGKEHFQTHSMKLIITLIPKLDKDMTKKNYRLMNKNSKILNEILANLIQQHIKKIIHNFQVGFIPGIQGRFNIH
jgi:hypothetical protein